MSTDRTAERIAQNPRFLELVRTRNRYSIIMTALMMIVYFGYILLVAFNKPLLATKLSEGATTSLGVPLGLGVLVFTIILTAIYVRRANTEFDTKANAIIAEAVK